MPDASGCLSALCLSQLKEIFQNSEENTLINKFSKFSHYNQSEGISLKKYCVYFIAKSVSNINVTCCVTASGKAF